MNPHGIPYLRFIVPFISGLALGAWLDIPLPYLDWGLMLGAAFGVLLAIQKIPYRHRWVFGAYVHLLLLGFGYFHIISHSELRQDRHFSPKISDHHYFLGTVYEAPSRGAKMKIPVRVEAIGSSPDSLQAAAGNVMLFLEVSNFADSIRYGDRLGFQATLRPTEPPKNPHAFDYARYLHFQNINYQAFIKPDSVMRLSAGNGHLLWRKAYESRARLLDLLQKYFPSTDEYAVASALLVGYTDDLSDDMRTAYAETGSMHALAVSGTHIGMLYVGLMFMIGRLRLRGKNGRLIETVLVLTAIWAFTFLTGATASVLRASVMFTVYMFGKAFWRDASAWNVLPTSAFILLIYNPYFLFNVGFQLSYAAVAGMVFFYPRFYKMFPPMSRWLDEPLQVFLVGVAAQLGTLPLSLFYFNQFPVYFWLAGWVVVFVGAVFLWGGAILVLLDSGSQILADWLGMVLYYMILWMNKIIFFIQSIPGGVVRNVWVPGWVVLALYTCLALLGAAMVTRRGKWLGAFAGVMVLLGMFRTATVLGKQQQRSTVIYSVNKARLIDFFEGDRTISLSDTLTKKQESFAAQANRTASGTREKTTVLFSDTVGFFGDNLLIALPFVQFFDQKMVLVDDARWVSSGNPKPLVVEVLVLSKSPKISVAECRARFPCALVVFDASNTFRQAERWRNECALEGWAFHDVRTMGAWVGRR
ncbi:MAG: ComEC/Rec2 family competence protein [Saprospiraceae bacterium]|nr:ComEC/Rec2 family competence protein [Saprospiraceae bacterium]